jgi:hypothetical protein
MHQHTQQAVCAVHHQPGRHGAETLRPLVAVRGTPQSNQTASATVCNTRSLPTMLPSRSHSTASRTDVDQPTAAVQRDCAAVANAHGRPQRAAPLRARRQRSPRMIRRPTLQMIEPFRVVKLRLREEDVGGPGQVQSRPSRLRRPDNTMRGRRGRRRRGREPPLRAGPDQTPGPTPA